MSFEPLEFPPWIQWGQRRGAILSREGWPLGPNGRKLCAWCKTELSGRRQRWCSDACVRLYSRVWDWAAMKKYIKERDGHKCQRCGTTDPPPPKKVRGWQQRLDPWDVDHILPVADGGTDDPENLRLLCIPCHVAVGYEQRAARRGDSPPDAEPIDLFESEAA